MTEATYKVEKMCDDIPPKILREKVVESIKGVFDPEIPVNIWELGLIYRVEVMKANTIEVDMTLTAPGCPVAGTLPGEVETRIKAIDGVADAKVALVWEPPWTKDLMSEAAKLELGMFD